MKINFDKTKIVIFRPSGRLTSDSFFISGHGLECVTKYKYLGIYISSCGSFKNGIEELTSKGQKAWYSLRSAIGLETLNNSSIMLKLFDSMIRPIITYGCEIWQQQFYKSLSCQNINNCDNIPFEKLHNRICKQIIGVGKYSSNIASRTELGRLPISVFILKQTLNYWFKLVHCNENSLLHQCLLSEKMLDTKGIITWYTNIKDFVPTDLTNCNSVKIQLKNSKTNIVNKYEQNTINFIKGKSGRTINQNNKLRTYAKLCNDKSIIKTSVQQHNFSWHLKRSLTKFRIGDHHLRIETGRHVRPKLPPEERICFCCNTGCVEDEIHFLVTCPAFLNIREKYNILPNLNDNSNNEEHFVSLLNSTDITISSNVALYLQEAFAKRTELLK